MPVVMERELPPPEERRNPTLDPSLQRGRNHEVNVGPGGRLLSSVSGFALTGYGLWRRSVPGVGLALIGGSLIRRGLTGRSRLYAALGLHAEEPGGPVVRLDKSITVMKPRADLYRVWRSFESLPDFMAPLHSVQSLPGGRSRWVAHGPLGTTVEWVVHVTEDVENERLGWSTAPDAEVCHQGGVTFQDAPGDRGTVVHVWLQYTLPLGAAGAVLGALLGEDPRRQLADSLRRFKQRVETGEIATAEPQPAGRRSLLGQLFSRTLQREAP